MIPTKIYFKSKSLSYLLLLILIGCSFEENRIDPTDFSIIDEKLIDCRVINNDKINNFITHSCTYKDIVLEKYIVDSSNIFVQERELFDLNGEVLRYEYRTPQADLTFRRDYLYENSKRLGDNFFQDEGKIISYIQFRPNNIVLLDENLTVLVFCALPPHTSVALHRLDLNGNILEIKNPRGVDKNVFEYVFPTDVSGYFQENIEVLLFDSVLQSTKKESNQFHIRIDEKD